jgi:hypothetical protein
MYMYRNTFPYVNLSIPLYVHVGNFCDSETSGALCEDPLILVLRDQCQSAGCEGHQCFLFQTRQKRRVCMYLYMDLFRQICEIYIHSSVCKCTRLICYYNLSREYSLNCNDRMLPQVLPPPLRSML